MKDLLIWKEVRSIKERLSMQSCRSSIEMLLKAPKKK